MLFYCFNNLELVLDSLHIMSSDPICQRENVGAGKVLLDSVQHNRQQYSLVLCGNHLSLFKVNTTGLSFLNEQSMQNSPILI